MKYKNIKVDDNKFIKIYDDVFTYAEMSQLFDVAKKSKYILERTASSTVPVNEQFKTLKSEYTIYDLLWSNFFQGPSTDFLKEEIKEKNLRLHRVYINLSTAQDIYHFHTDSGVDQDITLLYYFNCKWESHWEGETHFGDPSAREIIHSTSFLPGRLVLFTATIPHKSSQPSFLAPEFRYVLTMKFSSKYHSDFKRDFPIGDLFLTDDIEISDFEREAIAFLSKQTQGMKHSGSTFFLHCFNTYKILKNQGKPLYVCLAGLFHSAYGTEFRTGFFKDREILQNVIGEPAEELVFRFCNLADRDKELLDPSCTDIELITIAYANVLEEKFRDQSTEEEIIDYKNKLEEIKGQ
jgi:hypothetical protein